MNAADDNPRADDNVLVVTDRLQVPLSEFTFTFARSSGPGGQRVNKVSTKVRLRWNVADSPSLSEDVRQRFLKKYCRRITPAGELQVVSQRYRDRRRNVEDCLQKLREMLCEVAVPPTPRKKTRTPRAAKERRLADKRQRSAKKQRRRPPHPDD